MSGLGMLLQSFGINTDDLKKEAAKLNDRVVAIEGGIAAIHLQQAAIMSQNSEILQLIKQGKPDHGETTADGRDTSQE